jgi:hypothetical protein
MFPRNHQLRIGERNLVAPELSLRNVVKPWMVTPNTRNCLSKAEAAISNKIFSLLLVLFKVRTGGNLSIRHTKLLSLLAWSPHESGWKEDSSNCRTGGGHGPFRGLDAPFALRPM